MENPPPSEWLLTHPTPTFTCPFTAGDWRATLLGRSLSGYSPFPVCPQKSWTAGYRTVRCSHQPSDAYGGEHQRIIAQTQHLSRSLDLFLSFTATRVPQVGYPISIAGQLRSHSLYRPRHFPPAAELTGSSGGLLPKYSMCTSRAGQSTLMNRISRRRTAWELVQLLDVQLWLPYVS
jgi:hypothetical protein